MRALPASELSSGSSDYGRMMQGSDNRRYFCAPR